MFDESFFVAAAFFTVIGAFIYLKLPSKLMQSLDEKSAQIAKELDDAKALRAEAEKVLADYEEQRKQAEAQAEQMIADAKASAERTAAEAREAMQAAMERRTKQAEEKIARAQENLEKEVRAAITSLAVDAAAHLVATGMTDEMAQKLVDGNIAELGERLN
ncbi:ATP F0F1 synthase subunit B [Alphaproteobacteria bacterium]|nr:ATP F0F1 synthase subunit B [PS1 clade bacterium]MBL6783706.1 ATP F0F1 synthase subunit B [PS1 clade bacterium]MDB2523449.1 ATP F0F1 synthase subunit B [Alphaproteobacteria bacterium]